jgi:hypothetical protein
MRHPVEKARLIQEWVEREKRDLSDGGGEAVSVSSYRRALELLLYAVGRRGLPGWFPDAEDMKARKA